MSRRESLLLPHHHAWRIAIPSDSPYTLESVTLAVSGCVREVVDDALAGEYTPRLRRAIARQVGRGGIPHLTDDEWTTGLRQFAAHANVVGFVR